MSRERFSLVFVCTANRFRSPLAAALVERAAGGLDIDVRSYATLGPEGRPALEEAVAAAHALGLDLAAHVTRRLSAGGLAAADLVLGFERSHVAAAVVDGGAPRERTFTLPELVELGEEAPAPPGAGLARARAVVADAAARRGAGTARPSEVADPAGGPEDGYRLAATQVEELAARLVRVLFGPAAASTARIGFRRAG